MYLARLTFKLMLVVLVAVQCVACDGAGQGSNLDPGGDDVIVMPGPQENPIIEGDNEDVTVSDPSEQSQDLESKITVSGFLTYDRVPFHDNRSSGLNYDEIERMPMRGVMVYAIDSNSNVIAETSSSAVGDYSLQVPKNSNIKIRVGAKLYSESPAWDITVKDNTRGGMSYVIEGSLASTGNEPEQVRNIHAGSGWKDDSYQEARSSAPFAILDSIYDSVQVMVATDSQITLPKLTVFWSEKNIAVNGDRQQGFIGSSMYNSYSVAIYILGKVDNDADEFDRAVIQHEFGHYVEDQISRSESIGGSHTLSSDLDMRVAFGEAWGNAFAAMSSGDSVYRDAFGRNQKYGFYFDVEKNEVYKPGWFSERSLQAIIYDLFDSVDDGADEVSLGAISVIRALTSSEYLEFEGASSIYPFIELIKQQNPSLRKKINNLLVSHEIYGQGMYGEGETNDAGAAYTLPIYHTVQLGETVNVCSGNTTREYNGADVNRFVLFNVAQKGSYTIDVVNSDDSIAGDSTGSTNPQLNVYEKGEFLIASRLDTHNQETLGVSLDEGTYLLQVYEQSNSDNKSSTGGLSCFDVSFN